MQLEIQTAATPAGEGWRKLIERHCSLTLRPLGPRVRRVTVRIEQATGHQGCSYFVSHLRANTSRRPVHVRIQHASADFAIALAFARARRELLRQFGP